MKKDPTHTFLHVPYNELVRRVRVLVSANLYTKSFPLPQGFWDMVFYEVTGLYGDFDELGEMEKNGWQTLPPSPKKPKLQVGIMVN